MKRGTPRHPKVYDLLQCLELPVKSHPLVIGYLELLWHFTSEFAPQGDIGKYSDSRIEGAMGWTGKPGRLVKALTTTRWCDESALCRLVVHDWHDHADDSVKKKLDRAHLPFLSLTAKVTGHCPQPSQTTAENICLPLPLPLPCQASACPPPDIVIGECVERIYALHPKKKNLALVPEALQSAVKKGADISEIEACHAAWCKTEDWSKGGGRFAPPLDQWLADRGFTQWPNGDKSRPPGVWLVPEGTKIVPFDPFNPKHHQNDDTTDMH